MLFAAAGLFASLALLAIVIVAAGRDIPSALLTRDPATIAHLSPFYGALSMLGGLIWAAATGVWLTLAALARESGTRRFAIFSCLLTLYLCVDDAFLIHDYIAPRRYGIAEEFVLAALALAALAYIVVHARRLWRTRWFAAAAFGCLGLSVVCDLAQMLFELSFDPGAGGHPWGILGEDGFKWFGIVFWLALALAQTRLALRQSEEPALI